MSAWLAMRCSSPRIIFGDDNLGADQALEALQREHNEDPAVAVIVAVAVTVPLVAVPLGASSASSMDGCRQTGGSF